MWILTARAQTLYFVVGEVGDGGFECSVVQHNKIVLLFKKISMFQEGYGGSVYNAGPKQQNDINYNYEVF